MYRTYLWYPSLVTHLFSICTPFFPVSKGDFVPLEVRVETTLSNFRYQIQLASGDVEKKLQSEGQIRCALSAIFGGRGPNNESGFSTREGFIFENLPKIGASPLLSADVLTYFP